MSLINKMLQDLDARRAPTAGGNLPAEVRPLAAEPVGRTGGMRLVGIVGVVAGALWWGLGPAPLTTIGSRAGSTLEAPPTVVATTAVDGRPIEVAPPSPTAPVADPSNLPLSASPSPEAPTARPLAGNEGNAVGGRRPAAEAVGAVTAPASPPRRSDDGLRLSRVLALAGQDRTFVSPVAAAPVTSPLAATGGRVDKRVRPQSAGEQAAALYHSGLASFNLGRADEAIERLRSALTLDSANGNARQVLIRALREQRRETEAVAVLDDGLRRHPEQIQWALYRARLHLERGDLDPALATLRQASEPATGSHEYRGFLAALLQRAGQHGGAVEAYRRALALAPAEGRYWVGLGISLEAIGEPATAQESYRRAQATATLPADLQAFVGSKLR